jgi:aminoglycoside phosphotransferase (APT) family kinase protein
MLHEGEYPIDDDIVAHLIDTQMPQWADLPLRRLDTAGTVNAAYKLGADKLVRLPRHPDFSEGPEGGRVAPGLAPTTALGDSGATRLGIPC